MDLRKKVVLTDRFLKALKPAPAGKRFIVWDAIQPHLGVRVTDHGRRSFIVVMRRAGERRPTRHFLGSYPAVSIADARLKAPKIISTLLSRADPKEQDRQRLREAKIIDGIKFGVVIDDYILRHVAKLRSKRSVTLTIRRELQGLRLHRIKVNGKWQDEWRNGPDSRWRDMALAKITRGDVVELLEKIADNGSRFQARKVFAILSKFFKWAILRDAYGIETNPTASINSIDILGSFKSRSRVLSDKELQRVWKAANRMSYPFGTLVQILMLTGQRLREISDAAWCELHGDVLVIPESRMKAKIDHSVPLANRTLETLARLPKFQPTGGNKGHYIFTTTSGERPLGGFSKYKKQLDTLINKDSLEIPAWTLHDLRRTVRTRLSTLKVPPHVAELVIGHKQTGIHAVYDLHSYDDEKRAALILWESKLMELVDEPRIDKGGITMANTHFGIGNLEYAQAQPLN